MFLSLDLLASPEGRDQVINVPKPSNAPIQNLPFGRIGANGMKKAAETWEMTRT